MKTVIYIGSLLMFLLSGCSTTTYQQPYPYSHASYPAYSSYPYYSEHSNVHYTTDSMGGAHR